FVEANFTRASGVGLSVPSKNAPPSKGVTRIQGEAHPLPRSRNVCFLPMPARAGVSASGGLMSEVEKREAEHGDLVVIGSSAGGVEAVSILVGTLPLDFPAPLVLAQH